MTDTTVSDAVVFPQDAGTGAQGGNGDYVSGGYLGLLAQTGGAAPHVGEGLGLTVDAGADEADVAAGHAYVQQSGVDVQSGSQSSYDTSSPSTVSVMVVLPTAVTLALDADASNDIYLAVDPTSQDSVYLRHGSSVSEPGDPSVKLGTVDTSDGSVTELNRTANVGRATISTTEPPYIEGDSYIDPSTGAYYVAYGGEWHPVPPVSVLQEAATFMESGVTITHDNTKTESGSISLSRVGEIVADFEDGSVTPTAPNWSDWSGATGDFSVISDAISGSYSAQLDGANDGSVSTTRDSSTTNKVKFDCRVNGTSSEYYDYTSFTLYNAGTRLGHLIFRSADNTTDAVYWVISNDRLTPESSDTVVLSSWSYDTPYSVELDFDFSADTVTVTVDGTTTSGLDLENSVSGYDEVELKAYENLSQTRFTVDNIETGYVNNSGEAVVSWNDLPSDIKSWDLVTFQVTPDGETATVDVEDATGQVLFSDIDPNFDISTVDPTTDVHLRGNLSREDASNDPRIDYVARRCLR